MFYADESRSSTNLRAPEERRNFHSSTFANGNKPTY
jgi:hypothetical protein